MGISYHLELATPSSTAEVAEVLAAYLSPAEVLAGTTTAAGTWFRVAEVSTPAWQVVVAGLGITPTVLAAFEPDKNVDQDRQLDAMVRLVADLLAGAAGDAVLHQDNQYVWLVRHADKLTVSDRPGLWTPERLAALPQPYHHAPLSFAE